MICAHNLKRSAARASCSVQNQTQNCINITKVARGDQWQSQWGTVFKHRAGKEMAFISSGEDSASPWYLFGAFGCWQAD
eukprot:1922915-Amphidinium_carterae.1